MRKKNRKIEKKYLPQPDPDQSYASDPLTPHQMLTELIKLGAEIDLMNIKQEDADRACSSYYQVDKEKPVEVFTAADVLNVTASEN